MRPRHKVLVLASNEIELSRWRFLLGVHGFEPLPVASVVEGLRELEFHADCNVALVLVASPAWARALGEVRQRDGHVKVVLANVPVKERLDDTLAAAIVRRTGGMNAEVLHRLKTLAARKRGPKAFPRAAEELEEVAA